MAQRNRNLAAKFERAQRQRRDYAQGLAALEDSRLAHLAEVQPIIATHWGLTPAPITQEERDRAVADFMARGRIKKLPASVSKHATRTDKKYRAIAKAVRVAYDHA